MSDGDKLEDVEQRITAQLLGVDPNDPAKVKEAYVGFAKLKASVAAKGASDPGAVAAMVGRKKYGEKAMAHAAATGHSLKGHKTKAEQAAWNPSEICARFLDENGRPGHDEYDGDDDDLPPMHKKKSKKERKEQRESLQRRVALLLGKRSPEEHLATENGQIDVRGLVGEAFAGGDEQRRAMFARMRAAGGGSLMKSPAMKQQMQMAGTLSKLSGLKGPGVTSPMKQAPVPRSNASNRQFAKVMAKAAGMRAGKGVTRESLLLAGLLGEGAAKGKAKMMIKPIARTDFVR